MTRPISSILKKVFHLHPPIEEKYDDTGRSLTISAANNKDGMYYYDYEICMLHRQNVMDNDQIDFYIDSTMDDRLKMLPLGAFKQCMKIQLDSPFRATPVYLEGVWGGTFVKNLRHLPADMKNCAWVFDMIPNEVSLQIRIGANTFNIPFSTFFKANAAALMGEAIVRIHEDLSVSRLFD